MKHGLANDFDWGKALAHEIVVKVFEIERGALFLHHVGAKLHDFELAEGVIKVGSVGGAALCFHQGNGAGLVAVGDEEVDGLFEAELAVVELDGVDETGVAKQSILKLAETDEICFVFVFCASTGLAVALALR
jgi:hypothetical protein